MPKINVRNILKPKDMKPTAGEVHLTNDPRGEIPNPRQEFANLFEGMGIGVHQKTIEDPTKAEFGVEVEPGPPAPNPNTFRGINPVNIPMVKVNKMPKRDPVGEALKRLEGDSEKEMPKYTEGAGHKVEADWYAKYRADRSAKRKQRKSKAAAIVKEIRG